MSATSASLLARAPFSELQLKEIPNSRVVVSARHSLSLATLMARKAQEATLALRVREHFCVELPQGSQRAAAGEFAFAGLGPGTWLVTREGEEGVHFDALKAAVVDVGSIVDQSDGYAVLRLSGSGARDTLGKLVPLDLDECTFEVNTVACTAMGHVAGVIWRVDDLKDGAPVFEIAVPRSYSEYFWRVVSKSL